jgi:Ni/Co efflux regulator RcnB
MTRILTGIAALMIVGATALPIPAGATEQGITKAQSTELSSQRRWHRHRHWGWHRPHWRHWGYRHWGPRYYGYRHYWGPRYRYGYYGYPYRYRHWGYRYYHRPAFAFGIGPFGFGVF